MLWASHQRFPREKGRHRTVFRKLRSEEVRQTCQQMHCKVINTIEDLSAKQEKHYHAEAGTLTRTF